MDVAAVPVTTVDEHGDPSASEDKVCSATECRQRSGTDPESETSPMCCGANRAFGICVTALVCLHALSRVS